MTRLDQNKTYILDEFLSSVKEEERAEFYEGAPVFMATASYEHERIIGNLIEEFQSGLTGKLSIPINVTTLNEMKSIPIKPLDA
ncbi:hypothetical protein [Lentibacillus salicampi]|uniref:Restriction endonuclease domain-containing protein n=1 Tax=Lentibacillus salicampi TaxID=175306 RepID=A0A4Y9A8V5_9BACI|nr:hypothetical protein [Lentibacillus salicampi]TFJ91865.1 hypothetical protein E4U82_15560 [Lentibacillus salicampi]